VYEALGLVGEEEVSATVMARREGLDRARSRRCTGFGDWKHSRGEDLSGVAGVSLDDIKGGGRGSGLGGDERIKELGQRNWHTIE